MRINRLFAAMATIGPLLCVNPLFAQPLAEDVDRPQLADAAKIRQALGDDAAEFWIYEDVKAGFAESNRTGKPLLVSIR